MTAEIVFDAVDLIQEELRGFSLGLKDIETHVAGLLAAQACVFKGGIEERLNVFRHDTDRDADDIHGSHLAARSAVGIQRSAVSIQQSAETERVGSQGSFLWLNAER
jgi:hypothetical protein